MSELTDKEKVIKGVYTNAASGYGSIRDTYVQANNINPGVRYIDVKEHLGKQQHRQTQSKYIGNNSFVSPHPLFEIEVDLIDLASKAEETMDIGIAWLALITSRIMLGVFQSRLKHLWMLLRLWKKY